MSTFISTFIRRVEITTARKAKDGKKGDVTRRVQIPVAECTIDADNIVAARADAAERMNAVPFADDVRVYVAADVAPLESAAVVARHALNKLYSRAAFDFAFRAYNSIISGKPNHDAADVIQSAALGLYDIDARAAVVERVAVYADIAAARADLNGNTTDAAEFTAAADNIRNGMFTEYFRRRAAYDLANQYLHDERAVKTTTARRDITDYFRDIDDDAADIYDDGLTPAVPFAADVADADDDDAAARRTAADIIRNAFISQRRARRRIIRKSFAIMNARQRETVKVYAATGSMRIAADVLGYKNQSSVSRHITAARKAVNDAHIVNLKAKLHDVGMNVAEDADERREKCIAAARAVIDDYSRIDAAVAAIIAPAFAADVADVPAAVAARVAAYNNAAQWTKRAAARELDARAAILDADERAAAARRRARERGLDADAVNIAERAAVPARAENIDIAAAYNAAIETVEHDARRATPADIERAERNAARRRRPSAIPARDITTPKNPDAVRIYAQRDDASKRRAAAVVAAIAARADAERAARDTYDAARKSKDVVTAEHAAERYDADMNAARRAYDAAVALADMRYMYETTTPAERAEFAARVAADAERRARERAARITPDMRNAALNAEYAADARRRRERRNTIAAAVVVLNTAADAEFNAELRRADIAARADKNARARIAAARRNVAAVARAAVPAARITMRSAIAARADISFMPRVLNGIEYSARCVAADVADMNAERAAIAARRNAE